MERIERELKCLKCLHEWESRVYEPKECPHCKKRLDWKLCDYVLPQEGKDEADNDNRDSE